MKMLSCVIVCLMLCQTAHAQIKTFKAGEWIGGGPQTKVSRATAGQEVYRPAAETKWEKPTYTGAGGHTVNRVPVQSPGLSGKAPGLKSLNLNGRTRRMQDSKR